MNQTLSKPLLMVFISSFLFFFFFLLGGGGGGIGVKINLVSGSNAYNKKYLQSIRYTQLVILHADMQSLPSTDYSRGGEREGEKGD